MATAVADRPAPDAEKPSESAGAEGPAPESSPEAPERACASCGKPLESDQEWCLNCGAAVPGALSTPGPTWRAAALILGATAILVLAAAAAAYAALTEPNKPGTVTQMVIKEPAAASAPPAAATVPSTTTATPTPTTPAAVAPVAAAKPPKIPLTPVTIKPSKTALPVKTPSASNKTSPTKSSNGGATNTTPSQPAILLDTDAASTYNPDGLPETSFGDPSLAIDGDNTTGWTAQVEPSTAPNMAAGLLIDLKDNERLGSVELITPTPGLTVQVYAAAGSTVPNTITNPEWVALSKAEVIKTKHALIKLSHSNAAFRFVTVWISKAPASDVGTPQAPGRVAINELELFAAK